MVLYSKAILRSQKHLFTIGTVWTAFRHWDSLDSKGIGLAIVDALNEEKTDLPKTILT
jgi:hypothetical protein